MEAKSYLSRGVSPTKDDVKKAVANQSKGVFPGAFCKIIEDLAGNPAYCMAVHADGAGTKSSVAYLMYRETGDPAWFHGIAQDSLVMNTDDLACIGATGNFLVSNTIGRNAHRVDAACLQAIIEGYDDIIGRLQKTGIGITMTGGETADVGDLVKTVICDSTIVVRIPRSQVINAAGIKPGQVIIGLSSAGKTTYETKENSGIGSNGLTAARHLLLSSVYREKYPESFSETIDVKNVYCGNYKLDDKLPGSRLTAGEAILSPTRTYLPVIKPILNQYSSQISGLIHCTGGGLVKCRDFGQGIRYVKDQLLPRPAIFEAIAESGEIESPELFQIFNMGQRMEIYCDETAASGILDICGQSKLEAKVIGYTEKAARADKNEVIIKDRGQVFHY